MKKRLQRSVGGLAGFGGVYNLFVGRLDGLLAFRFVVGRLDGLLPFVVIGVDAAASIAKFNVCRSSLE